MGSFISYYKYFYNTFFYYFSSQETLTNNNIKQHNINYNNDNDNDNDKDDYNNIFNKISSNETSLNSFILPPPPASPINDFYSLYIFFDSYLSSNIQNMYIKNANKHNAKIDEYFNNPDICFDSGFDLICPEDMNYGIDKHFTFLLNFKIRSYMKFKDKFVGYYLYSRSSTAIKTSFRLANSVGIIDSGYRGYIMACFDIIHKNTNINNYTFEFGNRYVQICPSSLDIPMKVFIINDNNIDINTSRSTGGFGSTD